jgi:sn-glycerol 3-phosphate transport system substrate-binding protein
MRILTAAALALSLIPAAGHAATDIDFFFPVPVQGKLSNEMQRLIGVFNDSHPDIHVTAVYTGAYDDTNLKTRAAIKAGHPPAVVIMSANFIREYVINDEVDSLDPLIAILAGAAPERDRERACVWRAVPELDADPVLQHRRLQSRRVGSREAADDVAGMGG